MIRTIQIDGFKSIVSQTVELGRVNCFIGANGAGKSNLLEAIGVLGAAASGRVDDESLLRRGVRPGMPRLYKVSFNEVRTPPAIGLGATGSTGAEYRVTLRNPLKDPKPAWDFKTETLKEGGRAIVSRGVRNNLASHAGWAALKVVELVKGDPAAELMECLREYAMFCPNTPTLRGLTPDQQTRAPVGLSGGRLAAGFSEFRRTSLGRDKDLVDSVLGLIDWVQEIETTDQAGPLLSQSVPHNSQVLKFTDRHMDVNRNTLTAHDASEGALYVLFCALLCLSSKAPKLVAMDNLDQALNPRLITRLTSKLSDWLQRADAERQLLFTVHNPAVLDGLDLTDDEVRLFAVERNSEGHTRINRIRPSEKLLALHQEYPLSRVWLMGHLGALADV